jgi:GMP synthase-like glutamine amidotransferase
VSKPGLILQHGDDGPPGRFGEWLSARGIEAIVHPIWRAAAPALDGVGWICSLGSECSAADPTGWVPGEIDLLRQALSADVPVLGLCFGGQALSAALGAGIRRLEQPEIGWIAVQSPDASIPPGPWLQYHYDLMLLPDGAEELARSPAGTAAFRHGRHLALQFHPEVDGALVDRWARADPQLARAGVTAAELARQSERHAEPARAQAYELFDRWWEGVGA